MVDNLSQQKITLICTEGNETYTLNPPSKWLDDMVSQYFPKMTPTSRVYSRDLEYTHGEHISLSDAFCPLIHALFDEKDEERIILIQLLQWMIRISNKNTIYGVLYETE